jgi:hypothetical protein
MMMMILGGFSSFFLSFFFLSWFFSLFLFLFLFFPVPFLFLPSFSRHVLGRGAGGRRAGQWGPLLLLPRLALLAGRSGHAAEAVCAASSAWRTWPHLRKKRKKKKKRMTWVKLGARGGGWRQWCSACGRGVRMQDRRSEGSGKCITRETAAWPVMKCSAAADRRACNRVACLSLPRACVVWRAGPLCRAGICQLCRQRSKRVTHVLSDIFVVVVLLCSLLCAEPETPW